ncbi:MAG: hypothetical protein ACLFSM_09565 [Thermoplasmata archaeon]
MKKLYYGTEDEDGKIPGNVFEEGESISSVLIPSKSLSNREKPGEIEIKEEMENDPLKHAEEIDPSEYLVKRWNDGKAKRIYSGMVGSLEDRWKDVDSIEIYGNGKIYADEERVKGDFTITHGSTVLIRDVQDIAERTDQEIENEYFHCIHCDKEIRSYRAIENALPDDWVVDPDETDRDSYMERRDDGSIVLKGICPDCAEKIDED